MIWRNWLSVAQHSVFLLLVRSSSDGGPAVLSEANPLCCLSGSRGKLLITLRGSSVALRAVYTHTNTHTQTRIEDSLSWEDEKHPTHSMINKVQFSDKTSLTACLDFWATAEAVLLSRSVKKKTGEKSGVWEAVENIKVKLGEWKQKWLGRQHTNGWHWLINT